MSRSVALKTLLVAVLITVAVVGFVLLPRSDAETAAPQTKDVRAAEAEDKRPALLVVGDSLSAGYGLTDVADGWVALLQGRLDDTGLPMRVVNASISGDTSAGGAARLPAAIERHQPQVVIIELGGNDGLRGLPLDVMQQNFESMINASQAIGAEVILFGMMIPPNYGERYTQAFIDQYKTLSSEFDTALVPFFLEDVALDASLMQADGIHPNEQAQPIMLNAVWPTIETVVRERLDTP
ncbi:MAG: arylesterase [Pseudomonadota bacterium]